MGEQPREELVAQTAQAINGHLPPAGLAALGLPAPEEHLAAEGPDAQDLRREDPDDERGALDEHSSEDEATDDSEYEALVRQGQLRAATGAEVIFSVAAGSAPVAEERAMALRPEVRAGAVRPAHGERGVDGLAKSHGL